MRTYPEMFTKVLDQNNTAPRSDGLSDLLNIYRFSHRYSSREGQGDRERWYPRYRENHRTWELCAKEINMC